MVSEREITALYEKGGFFPRLKSAIFSVILSVRHDLYTHMTGIFNESQMTTFNFCYLFLTDKMKTRAHVDLRVLEETPGFMAVVDALKEGYGEAWTYFKLLEPTNQLTALTKFPAIKTMAMSYAYHRATNKASIENIAGMKSRNTEADRLVSTPLESKYLENATSALNRVMELSPKLLNTGIKLIEYYRDREQALKDGGGKSNFFD
jgi:hypothetical protein